MIYAEVPSDIAVPMTHISREQRDLVDDKFPAVKAHLEKEGQDLPGWVPTAVVAEDLGFDDKGVKTGLKEAGGKPFLWATEFENQHPTWKFTEPVIEVDGVKWGNAETYYQSQKPKPFDEAQWKGMRDDVMRTTLRAKLEAAPEVKELLLATVGHPLVSIKRDYYWGVHPVTGGENRLAKLWMELRDELVAAA